MEKEVLPPIWCYLKIISGRADFLLTQPKRIYLEIYISYCCINVQLGGGLYWSVLMRSRKWRNSCLCLMNTDLIVRVLTSVPASQTWTALHTNTQHWVAVSADRLSLARSYSFTRAFIVAMGTFVKYPTRIQAQSIDRNCSMIKLTRTEKNRINMNPEPTHLFGSSFDEFSYPSR